MIHNFINDKSALVKELTWCQLDKPLPKPISTEIEDIDITYSLDHTERMQDKLLRFSNIQREIMLMNCRNWHYQPSCGFMDEMIEILWEILCSVKGNYDSAFQCWSAITHVFFFLVTGSCVGYLQCWFLVVCPRIETETPSAAVPNFSALCLFSVIIHRGINTSCFVWYCFTVVFVYI